MSILVRSKTLLFGAPRGDKAYGCREVGRVHFGDHLLIFFIRAIHSIGAGYSYKSGGRACVDKPGKILTIDKL